LIPDNRKDPLPTALFNTKLPLNNGHPRNRTFKIVPYMHRARIMAHTLEDKPYDPFLEADERTELD